MQRTMLSTIVAVLLLLYCSGVLVASEVDELRERAKAIVKEIAVLTEQGNLDEANQLRSELKRTLETATRLKFWAEHGHGADKESRHLKERLGDLRAQEKKLREGNAPEKELVKVREQIANTERRLQTITEHAEEGKRLPEVHAQAEKLAATTRRIHHLRIAAENLRLADVHEMAAELMEMAETLERDVREAKQRLAGVKNVGIAREHGPDVVKELRKEIDQLRAEVKELRKQSESRKD